MFIYYLLMNCNVYIKNLTLVFKEHRIYLCPMKLKVIIRKYEYRFILQWRRSALLFLQSLTNFSYLHDS